jgi:signal transduction histidine kinase/ActR/RegA family two-component response regulator
MPLSKSNQQTLPTAAPSAPDGVLRALVNFVASEDPKTSLVIVLVLGTMCFIVNHRLPFWLLLGWFLLGSSILLARAFAYQRIKSNPDRSFAQNLNVLTGFSLIKGLFIAAVVLSFPWLSVVERSFLTVFIMGLCAGAVGTTSGHPRLWGVNAVPIFLSLILGWTLSPADPLALVDGRDLQWVDDAIAALLLLYAGVLAGLAKETYQNFSNAHLAAQRAHELNAQLSTSLEELKNSNAAKIRFLAAASHDLRQPVHAQSMLIATLQMRTLDEKSQQIVGILQNSSQSLAALLESLLDISKLDAGLVKPSISKLNLGDLLQRCFDSSKAQIEQAGLQAVLQKHDQVILASDSEIVLRILRNLVDNAIKFTSQGFVRFEQGQKHGQAYLAIQDSGIGIAPELHDTVFQEFFQVGNHERDRSNGLGLGLSIVKRLCELIDIRLEMTSSPAGTRFELFFKSNELIQGVTMSAIESAGTENLSGLEVLIVDDEFDVRRSMSLLLEELGCHPHETQSTSEVALKVQHFRPDLMLADFRLKNHDSGIASIAALRERWPGVPAVLVSGDTAPERLLEAQAAGVRILHKPLALDALRIELAQAWKLKQTLATQTSPLQA